MNLTKAPFNDVGFRRAISYAIDRKMLSDKAISGYAEPASQTGLILPTQKDWLTPEYQDSAVLPFDPDKAKQLFTAAGYTYDDSGRLLGKNGKPMSFSFKVQAGYLDWISAAQVIKANLKEVGISLDVRTADPGEVENDRALGFYDMEFGAPYIGCSMFQNYDDPLGSERTAPVGKQAATNFIRWKDEHTDRLLAQLNAERDPAEQRQLVAGLQQIMVEQVPYITLWYGPIWWEYRTAHAVGWPSAQDPYAGPGDWLLIFTRLRPARG
jgi:peptide/nickel transport system substrate-binding protein